MLRCNNKIDHRDYNKKSSRINQSFYRIPLCLINMPIMYRLRKNNDHSITLNLRLAAGHLGFR